MTLVPEVAVESTSRYAFTEAPFDGQPSLEETQSLVGSLRNTFFSDKTLSYGWRLQQLNNLERMLTEGRKELQDAVYADLRKPEFEIGLTEFGRVLDEIHLTKAKLAEWMKPVSKSGTPLVMPSWSTIQRDPLGVVLIFGAWNYPLLLTLVPLVGAIAGGNCAIIKPGSFAVNSSHALKKLIHKYMDLECFRVVEGNPELTHQLLDQKFYKIFFPGCGVVGKIVAAAAAKTLTPIVLELGGKNPCVVDKTAGKYLEHGVRRMIYAMCVSGGQTCTRPDFGLVHEDIADDFFKMCQKIVIEMFTKDPKRQGELSRIINDGGFKRLANLVKVHEKHIVVGGETDAEEKFIAPTVFDFGNDLKAFAQSEIMQGEIFGPLFPVATYKTTDEAVQFIRNIRTGKPLALYAFGSDSAFLREMKTRTTAGGMAINDCLVQVANPNLPFGGVGASGMGSYHGKYSFDCFTHEKPVLQTVPFLETFPYVEDILGTRFPPYPAWKYKMISLMDDKYVSKAFRMLPAPMTVVKLLAVIISSIAFNGVLQILALCLIVLFL